MFKSSENLRLAAEMRALTRVASPWREARATWWDGTPESLEARLAATDKVLVHAQSGFTAAHLELTREALAARRELLAARHRLLYDFLDDSARAFKGSKRVAGNPSEGLDEPHSGGYPHWLPEGELPQAFADAHRDVHRRWPEQQEFQDWMHQNRLDLDSLPLEEQLRPQGMDDGPDFENDPFDPRQFGASRRMAQGPDLSNPTGSDSSLRHRDDKENNRFTIQQVNGGPDLPGRAIVNHDSSELMSADGAHHWANRKASIDEACEDCGADAGEKCRPWCTGEAKHDDEKKSKKTSFIADFDDQLLF